MEVSREKCGKKPPAILVTGEIIARKVSVFNFIRMAISMKECGLWTKSMVKVLTGDKKLENLEENILEIGLKIKNMEEELSSLRIVIDMMDIG